MGNSIILYFINLSIFYIFFRTEFIDKISWDKGTNFIFRLKLKKKSKNNLIYFSKNILSFFFFSSLGFNGKSCTLRTLCELAEAPFEHGIYGEIVNLVLT